ncbi:MAG TPA: alpha/beta hydrolase [Micromonosporaceae bacterium]|nr:alpha/beta hydrolase [Micromonosporaceae bacterium]
MSEVATQDPDRSAIRRRVEVLGAVLGVAAGAAAGYAAERMLTIRSRRRAADPHAEEHFGPQPYDESLTVTTDDGLGLHVEIVDPVDGVDLTLDFLPAVGQPAPTLIFVHGFCLDMGTFYFQRKELARLGDWRMVFYDQPGHGRSGRLAEGEYTLESLGQALRRVIEETAPGEPVVLIGHSMGGMAIMALAELHPQLFAEQVVGTALVATSAGRLEAVRLGLPEIIARTGRPLLPLVNGATRMTGVMLDRARTAASNIAWQLTRRYGFGAERPSPALVSFVERMNSRTPTETVARYLRTLYTHSRYPALEALRHVPVLVVVGDKDPITPARASAEICRRLPDAELVTVPDSGHVVLLEHAETVNDVLLRFLEKICP